jgi:hypothetical protein
MAGHASDYPGRVSRAVRQSMRWIIQAMLVSNGRTRVGSSGPCQHSSKAAHALDYPGHARQQWQGTRRIIRAVSAEQHAAVVGWFHIRWGQRAAAAVAANKIKACPTLPNSKKCLLLTMPVVCCARGYNACFAYMCCHSSPCVHGTAVAHSAP